MSDRHAVRTISALRPLAQVVLAAASMAAAMMVARRKDREPGAAKAHPKD